jgi:hypothetical protein
MGLTHRFISCALKGSFIDDKRDAAFAAQVSEACDLDARRLAAHEMMLCAARKTSLQPRTRKSPRRSAPPGRPGWWFSTPQRKRLCVADRAESAERLQAFIRERNEVAHPFAWNTKSTAELMAKCEPEPPAKPDAFRLAA